MDDPPPHVLIDAMLADSMFPDLVADRHPHALFHTSVDGPWCTRGFYSWSHDGSVGGPAPEETVRSSQVAGACAMRDNASTPSRRGGRVGLIGPGHVAHGVHGHMVHAGYGRSAVDVRAVTG